MPLYYTPVLSLLWYLVYTLSIMCILIPSYTAIIFIREVVRITLYFILVKTVLLTGKTGFEPADREYLYDRLANDFTLPQMIFPIFIAGCNTGVGRFELPTIKLKAQRSTTELNTLYYLK